jgi:hypothetical protein
LNFVGKTIGRVFNDNKEMYEVVLDEAPAITLTIAAGSLKYFGRSLTGRNTVDNAVQEGAQSTVDDEAFEDLLDDAVQEKSCDEVDLTNTDGWQAGEVFHDNRIVHNNSFRSEKASLCMISPKNKSPCDYFLHFLPMHQFITIIGNINTHGRNVDNSWKDVTINEYLMWIALLTIMTVVRHVDRKAYWHLGGTHFLLGINFSKYISMKRFDDIMSFHVFEIPSVEK